MESKAAELGKRDWLGGCGIASQLCLPSEPPSKRSVHPPLFTPLPAYTGPSLILVVGASSIFSSDRNPRAALDSCRPVPTPRSSNSKSPPPVATTRCPSSKSIVLNISNCTRHPRVWG
ncbi:hypothetical protein K458DRAFT_127451 [Lentithecium fluviatile CBS 122367]|uniref:Uncharacterized protein n=1 Tax=Lentithecium fluviatile CBS 122367 TaxID=1168545 RepID=A0A6G1JGP6_9PLEO|nr:hypothetical protein K458DRAFT_127451 [Lentithecium fluviatile CBS 122367]